MTLQRLAYFTLLAKVGPQEAAREFLHEASEEAVLLLMHVADWSDADVKDFELGEKTVLVAGQWGRFWLASPRYRKALLPPAPRIAPSGIVALARGLMDELFAVDLMPVRGVA